LVIAAPNVALLGLTSLITDVSSEMAASVLPLYLTAHLGFSALRFGLTDGLLQVVAAITALVTALLADRWRRYREAAGLGYALSAASRVGLLAAHGWLPVLAWLGADRVGKGTRTAPRDALLSLSAPPGRLTEAFGLHRALDTGGALAGPLLAVALLSAAPGSYPTVFASAFLIGVVGLALLLLFLRNDPHRDPGVAVVPAQGRADDVAAPRLAGRRWWAPMVEVWTHRPVRRLLVATLLLSLPAVGDSLLFLTLRHQVGVSAKVFPSLYVVESIGYLVLAVPAGRLADRVGAAWVLLGGQGALAGCCVLLAVHPGPAATVTFGLPLLLGVYYVATDGVLASLASQVIPASARTTGLALVGLALAAGRALAATGYGALWGRSGPDAALASTMATILVTAALAAALLHPLRPTRPPAPASPPLDSPETFHGTHTERILRISRTGAFRGAAGMPFRRLRRAFRGTHVERTHRGVRACRVRGTRVVAFGVLVVVCAGGVVGVTARAAREQAAAARASAATWSSVRGGSSAGDLPGTGRESRYRGRSGAGAAVPLTASPALLGRRHLLVLDATEGPDFGRVEAVDPDSPTGPRAPTSLFCDRVDQRAGRVLCLTDDRVHARAGTTVLDGRLRVLFRLPADGLPSRTRISPDGRLGAATTFVAGDAYNVDSFSTRTVLLDLVHGRQTADLEQFDVTRGGRTFHAIDENFWGVTFTADPDTFYATMHTGNHYYLIRGHMRRRRAEILRDGVECPSLSPDGTRIAYKSRITHGFAPATWRLHALTLATGADHPLAEPRNVDDQAAWLDDTHVTYAVATDGGSAGGGDGTGRNGGTGSGGGRDGDAGPGASPSGLADTWTVPADGTGSPHLLVSSAQSAVTVAAPS